MARGERKWGGEVSVARTPANGAYVRLAQVAKVYLSVYSDDKGKAAAVQNLQRLEGYVRKHIGRQASQAKPRLCVFVCEGRSGRRPRGHRRR